MDKMKLEKGKVYYRSDKEAWEYVQKNDVGKVVIYWSKTTNIYATCVKTPRKLEEYDYAFMLMPEPPKPKSLYEKVEELKSHSYGLDDLDKAMAHSKAINKALKIIKEHES